MPLYLTAPAPGTELIYAESTSSQTGVSSVVDLTGLASITFSVTSRPVLVQLWCPFVYGSASTAVPRIQIADGSNTIKSEIAPTIDAANGALPLNCYEHLTTPGSYTRKGRIRVTGTGTANCGVDSTQFTAFIRAIQV